MGKDSIKVSVRIKPDAHNNDAKKCLTYTDQDVVIYQPEDDSPFTNLTKFFSGTAPRSNAKKFTFDTVYGANACQYTVFNQVEMQLDQFFTGINCSLMVYGPSGAGKSYTIGLQEDPFISKKEDQCGIIVRALEAIMLRIEAERSQSHEFQLKLQAVELYQEDFIDLLSEKTKEKTDILLRESDAVYLQGAREVNIDSFDDSLRFLKQAISARTAASTRLNESSSRSHAIFTLTLNQRIIDRVHGTSTILKSKFHFVDLAGTERLKKSLSVGERQKEGISINQGLLVLGKVINALTTNSLPPYRESKLTRLLKDSLGGNSETLIITCIQDVAADYSETLPALTFAANAKTIINDIRVNITEERRLSMSNETGELRKKLRDLESQCRSLQDLLKSKDQELNALKSRNSTITDILVQPLSNEGKLNAIASSMDVVIPETVAERTQDITQKSLIPLTELFELKATVKKQNAIINSLRDLIDKDSEMPIIPRLFKFKPLGNQ